MTKKNEQAITKATAEEALNYVSGEIVRLLLSGAPEEERTDTLRALRLDLIFSIVEIEAQGYTCEQSAESATWTVTPKRA